MKDIFPGRLLFWKGIAAALLLGVWPCEPAGAQPYRVGDIVSTNFALQNRYRWTNDDGRVFTSSNAVFRLSDFVGKIVMFEFFAVW